MRVGELRKKLVGVSDNFEIIVRGEIDADSSSSYIQIVESCGVELGVDNEPSFFAIDCVPGDDDDDNDSDLDDEDAEDSEDDDDDDN